MNSSNLERGFKDSCRTFNFRSISADVDTSHLSPDSFLCIHLLACPPGRAKQEGRERFKELSSRFNRRHRHRLVSIISTDYLREFAGRDSKEETAETLRDYFKSLN